MPQFRKQKKTRTLGTSRTITADMQETKPMVYFTLSEKIIRSNHFRCHCKLQGRILHAHFIVGPFQDLSATWSGVLLIESTIGEERIKDKNHNNYFVLFK